MSTTKPKLSFWQIWNMSFGFLGIQFGFALQNANTSRIFETLGAGTKDLAFYWLAAPVTGLLVQPLIGYYSDRTWHVKWGRRRPYFAIGALLATLALIFMPNSPSLWIAIGMLWIMDASINVSMEPFRAFVGDMLPESQRTKGFAMQSFFIGTGAVIASVLPWVFTNWIGLSNTTEDGTGIPDSVKWSFYVGAAAFFLAVMWTVFTTKEYPPTEEHLKSQSPDGPLNIRFTPKRYLTIGIILLLIGTSIAYWFYSKSLDPQLYVLCGIFGLFGFSYVFAAAFMFRNQYRNGFVQIVRDFQNMPKTMVQLAYVQFFSWFALFAMWIYSTSGVTSHMYHMELPQADIVQLQSIANELPTAGLEEKEAKALSDIKEELITYQNKLAAPSEEVTVSVNFAKYFLQKERIGQLNPGLKANLQRVEKEYNNGADWVGILFAGYNGVAAIAAFLLTLLARMAGRKITHLIALSLGGIGLASFYFIEDPNYLIICMIGVGIAWASILSIPYAMLSSSIPQEKMGYYMGIFNFFIVIPQIVAASILGFLLSQFFEGEAIYALLIGGGAMILAGLLCLGVHDHAQLEVADPNQV
jgi:maltose/moltooligosaccharide transporter